MRPPCPPCPYCSLILWVGPWSTAAVFLRCPGPPGMVTVWMETWRVVAAQVRCWPEVRYGLSGSFSGDFKKLGECISLTGGTIMNRLKYWWKGEFWTRTHQYLAHARYNHVSWKVPGGVVLMGGAGGWRSAQLVSDDGTAEDLFGLNFELMWVTCFTFILPIFLRQELKKSLCLPIRLSITAVKSCLY